VCPGRPLSAGRERRGQPLKGVRGSGLRGFDYLLIAFVHGLDDGVVVTLVDRLAHLLVRLLDGLVDAVQVQVVDYGGDCR
jgi:hypothetical protein